VNLNAKPIFAVPKGEISSAGSEHPDKKSGGSQKHRTNYQNKLRGD
jgi:hypothetical protein